MHVDLKPRVGADAARSDRDHRGAAAEAAAGARHPRLHDQPAADQHRRPAERAACTSSRCRTPTPTSSISCAPLLEDKMRQLAGLEDVSSDLQVKNPQVERRHRSRQDLGARADRQPGRDRAVQRVRHAAGVADLRAEQPVPGHHAGRARVSARSGRAVDCSTSVGVQRPADSARHGGARHAPTVGPLHGQPHRTAAVGDDLVQPEAGRRARRRRRRRFRSAARGHAAVDDRHELPGRGAGVPGFAAGARPDSGDGDRRDLHRARHPVRELHASADDSLGAARRPASARCSRC